MPRNTRTGMVVLVLLFDLTIDRNNNSESSSLSFFHLFYSLVFFSLSLPAMKRFSRFLFLCFVCPYSFAYFSIDERAKGSNSCSKSDEKDDHDDDAFIFK